MSLLDSLRHQLREAYAKDLIVDEIVLSEDDYHEFGRQMVASGVAYSMAPGESVRYGGIIIRMGEETKVVTRKGMTMAEAKSLMRQVSRIVERQP